jgi:hypothetical protein
MTTEMTTMKDSDECGLSPRRKVGYGEMAEAANNIEPRRVFATKR